MRSEKLAYPLPSGMRDLLPNEAARRQRLTRRLLDHFALHGYALVVPPAFELSSVLERGLCSLGPGDVIRFVEPESGEVAALRPDMTPQIARMVATRLADRPSPMRLCYEGTVLRRRQERARKHRQIHQAGVELLGAGALDGDTELLLLAASSLEAAGLDRFVLDLGHVEVARALVADLPDDVAKRVFDALAQKDGDRVEELLDRAGADGRRARALRELPRLHGDASVLVEAGKLLAETGAEPALSYLRELWERASAMGLGSALRVDLGEVRGLAYYTGVVVHVFADGPGEAIGSGGRYDELLSRFGAPMPAAGFALDLDNLAWALEVAGEAERLPPKVLVSGDEAPRLCVRLREAGVAALPAVSVSDARAHAHAWGCSHLLSARGDALDLVVIGTGEIVRFEAVEDVVVRVREGA